MSESAETPDAAGGRDTKRRDRRGQENLDVRISIVPRGYVFAFAGLTLIASVAVFWGFFGSVPTKAQGEGILLRKDERIAPVQARAAGRISTLHVDVGDVVEAGAVLADLNLFELEAEIEATLDAIDDLELLLQNQQDRQTREIERHRLVTAETVKQISEVIAELEQGRAEAHEYLEAEIDLLRRGLANRRAELDARAGYQDIVSQIGDLQIQKSVAEQNFADLVADLAGKVDETQEQINVQQRKLTRLSTLSELERVVRAPISGIVQEIRAGVGQNVAPSDAFMTVAGGHAGSEVIAFLDSKQARRVELGMPVRVIPSSVNKAEFGSIRGVVSFVSTEPVSQAQANSLLQNPKLADKFNDEGSNFLARIEVTADPANSSGFDWWFGTGPDFQIKTGTLTNVEVVVREQPPVSLIVPAIRSLLGA